MRHRENYRPFIAAALALTVIIIAIFQIYIFREPARIRAQEAADEAAAVDAGRDLFADNCAACHGDDGEGRVGPPLNSKQLLTTTNNGALFALIRTGVPGSIMPAWGQDFGGPFTDEEIRGVVAFLRAWEPSAPEIVEGEEAPNPVRGAAIYARTCFVCHGENGMGTERAPSLNDPDRLAQFDDNWYRATIAHGRPARGMPTWGTVLSPAQINDLVALLAAWRKGEATSAEISQVTYIGNALYAIQQFDREDAEFYISAALLQANDEEAQALQEVLDLVRDNQLFVAKARIAAFLPPEEMGQALFASSCAACHGSDGTGGMGPNLHGNSFIQAQSDDDLVTFLLNGRQGTPMNGFEGIHTPEELQNIILVLRMWQE